MQLVQKLIVEDVSKASPLLPQHVALVGPDGQPLEAASFKQAANPGASPTVAKVVSALVEAGIMAPSGE